MAAAWHHPVTLVSAPAGFGKTSAVVAALHADAAGTVPVAWVGLDERDDDPGRFFRLIGAALQRATATAPSSSGASPRRRRRRRGRCSRRS
jgi:LuxR family transcriptional regulator, maltose regulon positive regulatory protein